MIRLLVVTLAALYAILHVFGDEARRPDVARSDPLALDLIKAAYIPDDEFAAPALPASEISDSDAIRMALEAGAEARAAQEHAPYLGSVQIAAASDVETTPDVVPAAYWYVTGTRVNLRSGPGTSNGVVGSLTLGAEAEVLGDDSGWYQIRTADGALSGWIHGKFLAEKLPG